MAAGAHSKQCRTVPVIRCGWPADRAAYNQMVDALTGAPNVTILTGAGISTSAGIPNIDGLQTRGRPQLSKVVLELHGNIHALQCSRCGQSPDSDVEKVDEDLLRQLAPGLLLPKVLLNEESREVEFNGMTMDELEQVDGSASLLLVIGTSIRTDGAAKLVKSLAKKVHKTGGTVVYIDRSQLQGSRWGDFFDVHIQAEIDEWARDSAVRLSEVNGQIYTREEKYLGLTPSLPPAETVVSSLASEPSELLILVCHSGAAPSLARSMVVEITELGKKCGRMCHGYVVVLSGSEKDLYQIPIRKNYQLIVVHVSDYMLRLRSPWKPIEPRQTIQELLKQSVQAFGPLSEQSNGQLLLMLCAEDELLNLDGINLVHGTFEKQSTFDMMVASLNMLHLRTRSWAKLALDIISPHSPEPANLANHIAAQWMDNTDLVGTSDLVVFPHGAPTTMLLASHDYSPLGKPLPDIDITCQCDHTEAIPSGKEWRVYHDAINGCPTKEVHSLPNMLIPLAQSLLLLFRGATGDEQLAFDCAPWTQNRWRNSFGLSPLETTPEEDEDIVDVGGELAAQGVASAADGFAFSPHALTTVGAATRQILTDGHTAKAAGKFMQRFWEQSCRDSTRNYPIEYTIAALPKDNSKKPSPQWPGFQEYRTVALAMLNRTGGVVKTVEAIMSRLGFTPVDKWKAARDVNRSEPQRNRKDEYDLQIPATNASLDNDKLHAEVARELFGKKAVSSGGIILRGYKSTVHTLLNRLYERNAKRLRSLQKKSRDGRNAVDRTFEAACKNRTPADLLEASKKLVAWRKTALESLEHDEPHFLTREKRLKDLWEELGFQQEDKPRRAASGSKGKMRSVIPTDEEMQFAYQYYIEEYCNGLGCIDDAQSPSTPPFMHIHQLIDEDNDIGVEHLKDWTKAMLWESAGVPGASQFPFAEPGTKDAKETGRVSKEAAIPYWHQQVGSYGILEGVFTANIGDCPCPTLLCDDVGLGKTIQIIGVFSMVRHYYEQQVLDKDKQLPPPPFTIANETPYFAGLKSIPNLPSLVISPRTLSDQWVEQWAKFTQSGAFSIVRYSVDQGPLENFCTNPNGAYLKAAGKNQERASSVIILATLSAVEKEAKRCLEAPDKSSKRKDVQLEQAKGEVAEFKSEVDTRGSLLTMKFRAVAVDECHNLRNSTHAQRGTQKLTDNSYLVIGATATMIFTSIWDALAQARIMRYGPVLGAQGVALTEKMTESIKDRSKEWDRNLTSIIKNTISQEAELAAAEAGISTEGPLFEDIRRQVQVKYENEEQRSILRSTYIALEAVKILRKVLRPIIIRRTGDSVDNEGKPILGLPPVQTLTAWSPMTQYEREVQQGINEEHRQRKKASTSGKKIGQQELAMIKWHVSGFASAQEACIDWNYIGVGQNFLMSQKDAAVHVLIYQMKKIEEEKRKAEGETSVKKKRTVSNDLVKSITSQWNASNIDTQASTRMLKVDEIIEHYWVGNPSPIAFNEDGTRDLTAAVREPWPCDDPRKFLVYVAYHIHRDVVGVMFGIKNRGYVCYDGSMLPNKRQDAVNKFNGDPNCRIMIISNVGSAGLNLVAASVVIVVSNVWSGLEKNQIFGRVVRPGQTRDVVLYNIIAPECIDLALMCYSESKTAQSNQFMMSRKALQQIYNDVTTPEEEEEDDAEDEVQGSSRAVKPTKVGARKRKGQDEDGPDDMEESNSGSPKKRARPSSNKKDAPVKGRRVATKAQSAAGPSHSKKASTSATQTSSLSNSNQAKEVPIVNNRDKSHQAELPKSQEGEHGVVHVPGVHGQVENPDLGQQGASTVSPAVTMRPTLKFKPPPALAASVSARSNMSSQSQSTAAQDNLHPSESQVAIGVVLPAVGAPLSSVVQDSSMKHGGFAKPPPKRAVIPGIAIQSTAQQERRASNAPKARVPSIAGQDQGTSKEVHTACPPITKAAAPTPGTSGPSQLLEPLSTIAGAPPPNKDGLSRSPMEKTVVPPNQARPTTLAQPRPLANNLLLAAPSRSATPAMGAQPPVPNALPPTHGGPQHVKVVELDDVRNTPGSVGNVGLLPPSPAMSASQPQPARSIGQPPDSQCTSAPPLVPQTQHAPLVNRPLPPVDHAKLEDDDSSEWSDDSSTDAPVTDPQQSRGTSAPGHVIHIWDLPNKPPTSRRKPAIPVQTSAQLKGKASHMFMQAKGGAEVKKPQLASNQPRPVAPGGSHPDSLSQPLHMPHRGCFDTHAAVIEPPPQQASSPPKPTAQRQSQGSKLVAQNDGYPHAKKARLETKEQLPSSSAGPSTANRKPIKRPGQGSMRQEHVINKGPRQTFPMSGLTKTAEATSQSPSTWQGKAPELSTVKKAPQSKVVRLSATVSSRDGQPLNRES
ncbi:hypothetical protein FRC11_014273 [Ceratobasidium sp. 423]|nr:hypothetical protein FRC11_014273 [Ceratobasidium sp. 423]